MTTSTIPTMSRRKSRKLLGSSTNCWMTTRSSTSHPTIISMLGMKPIKTLRHKTYDEYEIKIMTMFLRGLLKEDNIYLLLKALYTT